MLQLWDRKVHVHTAIQSSRPNEDEVIERIINLYESTNRQANIFVDAAAPHFIAKLKYRISQGGERNERVDYDNHIAYLRKHGWAGENDSDLPRQMTVVPVPFNKHGPRMLSALSTYIERGWLAVHPKFGELIQALQAARTQPHEKTDWSLDKSSLSLDLVDACRLCFYPMRVTPLQEAKQHVK